MQFGYIGPCDPTIFSRPMMTAGIAVATVLGVMVGSVLSVVAWRVPRSIPLLAGRGTDGVPARSLWWDVPIASHDSRNDHNIISVTTDVAAMPRMMPVLTGLLFGLMTWRFGVSWALPAYLTLAAAATLLGVVDLQHRRLPNSIVVPFGVISLALLVLAAVGTGAGDSVLRGIIGGALLFLLYLILALISPASLGMGDVKLAGVLGMYLAAVSWRTLAYGSFGAFIIAALVSIVLLVTRRASRRTQVPFGPAMLLAALVTIIVQGP